MKLRRFNDAGMQALRAYLSDAREDPGAPPPWEMLEDDALTVAVDPVINLERRQFSMRRDAAEYLRELLRPFPERRVANDAELWTWLTLFFFDEVCPAAAGRRSVKNDYSYVFEPKNPRHYYRHRLFIAWRIITVAPEHNRLFLSVPVPTLDKITEEVFKRLYLIRIPCLFEVLDRLYWDEERGKPRAGVSDPRSVKRGDIAHRFPIRIRQLEKTYDLISLDADQLLELLGPEFQCEPEPAAIA